LNTESFKTDPTVKKPYADNLEPTRHIERIDNPDVKDELSLMDTPLLYRAEPRMDKEEPSKSVFNAENLRPVPHLTW